MRLRSTATAMALALFAMQGPAWADMEAAISAQQHSTVSLIASEIDRSLNERNKILGELARRLGTAGISEGAGKVGGALQLVVHGCRQLRDRRGVAGGRRMDGVM